MSYIFHYMGQRGRRGTLESIVTPHSGRICHLLMRSDVLLAARCGGGRADIRKTNRYTKDVKGRGNPFRGRGFRIQSAHNARMVFIYYHYYFQNLACKRRARAVRHTYAYYRLTRADLISCVSGADFAYPTK